MNRRGLIGVGVVIGLIQASALLAARDLPSSFDLRNDDGNNYVTSVKSQQGGTCWTFGTMAAIEGNLMRTGAWTAAGETGEADLAEYHLDWWNGFNSFWDADIAPNHDGLSVHEGGNYAISAAYLSRGDGAVRADDANDYDSAPSETDPSYHHYYVRNIDWIPGTGMDGINRIKQVLMQNGVVGTGLEWGCSGCYSSWRNTFYQDPSDSGDPNHAVAIVGWDDSKVTQAPDKGAWLIKNSWGTDWGEDGYFWISYDDKVAGHDPDMGAVSFNGVEKMKYDDVYFHDYHGFRGTKDDASEAFNAFVAKGDETLKAVSFYTAVDNVTYTARVYRQFQNGELSDPVSQVSGTIPYRGFHTIDLTTPVPLQSQSPFYVYLDLSQGGQPLDKTADVNVVTGWSSIRALVKSTAQPGNSFYRAGNAWVDLTTYDKSASFCIKALAVKNE